MELREYIEHRRQCIHCGKPTNLTMSALFDEKVDDASVITSGRFSNPIIRKDFFTFNNAFFTSVYSTNPSNALDIETFNINKYKTFTIDKNNFIHFDKNFKYKMSLSFKINCTDDHYTNHSRRIRLSNKSNDITKGYTTLAEELYISPFRIICNKTSNETVIIHDDREDPVITQYYDLLSFPVKDEKKFIKKINNIILLA